MATEPLTDCLGFRISSAYRRVDRLFNRAFERLELTSAHGHVLMSLLDEGELRLADIAHRTGFDRSTVSRLVKELSRRRLVKGRRHPEDARARLLSPAKRGESLREEIDRIRQRLDSQIRRELVDADLQGFLRVTEVMDRLP